MPKTDSPRSLLARVSETAHLARAVPRLPAELLHGLVQRCGLEECGELLAMATTEQVAAVLDLDLWRADQPGTDERFDASRFCAWLEMFAESSPAAAARRLAEMDADLVIAGFAPQITVFDPGVFEPTAEGGDGGEVRIRAVLERGLHCEVGGYTVVAKVPDSWDTIVAVLLDLSEQHPDSFHRVMRGCRRLSNSDPEVDGLDDLLLDSEQGLFDLALGREGRREVKGYVTPAQAFAFLESSRQLRLAQDGPPPVSPVFAAYLRAAGWSPEPHERPESRPMLGAGDLATEHESAAAVAAVVGMLRDAGVLPTEPRALLSGPKEDAPRNRLLQEHMRFVSERNDSAFSSRRQELAFLANVVVAGGSLQARPLTPVEATEAVAATCNLGLENWPRQWGASHDLTTVFQVGWSVLHRNVSMSAAEQLLGTLGDVRCRDRETQLELHVLHREMSKHWRAGAPWRARNALEVIAILDMPAWAALLALFGELPVLLANVGVSDGAPPRTVSASAFEFISTNRQIASVREFMQSLPGVLSGPA